MFVGIVLGAIFVTPLVLTYLMFIRWADRFEPEPWWLVISAFTWGAVFATLGGGFASSVAERAAETIFHIQHGALDALGATVFAPIFEETFKGIGVAIIAAASALGLRELDGPLDGAIYGGVVGLGFTLTEDILYVANQYAAEGLAGFALLLILRTIVLGLSHCTFTACTGLAFGIAAESKSWAVKILVPMAGFLSAVAMHAMHNALPTFFPDGLAPMVIISWIIDIVYFLLLAVLVARGRAIVVRELFSEVGSLLDPRELKLVSSYFAISRRNWLAFRTQGWKVYRGRRQKQLDLVELAMTKHHRRRGETGASLGKKEVKLRQRIAGANAAGVWIG